jgi:putative hydrolase of the HAD superfamily
MTDLCVVFDIDDTLYLERAYVSSGFRAAGNWAAQWLSIPDFDRHCLRLFEDGYRGNVFDAALSACGYPSNPELIAGLVAIYRSHEPEIRMVEDASEAISQIRSVWPIAVITDGPVVSQSRKCEALGVTDLANPIVLTGTRGEKFHKPQKAAFEFVATRIRARRYVYVADNPAKDFTAPGELGWHSIRIRRAGGIHCHVESGPVLPEFEIPSCVDLNSLLLYICSRK